MIAAQSALTRRALADPAFFITMQGLKQEQRCPTPRPDVRPPM
jgi:hypothetical protein